MNHLQHFLSVRDLSAYGIKRIIKQAEVIHKSPQTYTTQGYTAANLFFEPSTRTKASFLMAEKKLGMDILDFQPNTSSLSKGESLYDIAKTYEAIGADLLVVRDSDDAWYKELAQHISVPMINAGSGTKDHPTQCMLDLFTIYQEFGMFKDLHVAIAGDAKHSRVAYSHAIALKKLGVHIYFVDIPTLETNEFDIPYVTMDEACEMCDVLMLLRIQHERHEETPINTSHYLTNYGLTLEREKKMRQEAIIMHPAPVNRGVEIDTRLVECPRSRIFKQMENSVPVRMAIIEHLLKERRQTYELSS